MSDDGTRTTVPVPDDSPRRGQGYSALCLACGFDRRGLDPNAACPECGWMPHDAQRSFIERMWGIGSGVDAGAWVSISSAVLVVLWLVVLVGVSYEHSFLSAGVILSVVTFVFCLVVPFMSAVSVWRMSRPPLVFAVERRWISQLTRVCGVGVLPLFFASMVVQLGSSVLGGAVAAMGIVAASGTLLGLHVLRRNLRALLNVPPAPSVKRSGSGHRLIMLVGWLFWLGCLVWTALIGGLNDLALRVALLGGVAYLLGFEASRYAMQQALRETGIGRRPFVHAWR